MYRVYDNKNKKWIKDKIFMSPDGDLYTLKNSIFSGAKLELLSDDGRYICHKDIELYDKENVLVYEGDYIRAKVSENNEEIGLVCYASELSAYVILCVDSDTFYTLGSEVSSEITVIGNVFDSYEDNRDGNKALSERKM